MRNNLSELVFILDRSGSMSGLERDTVGGFNSVLEKQRAEPGMALVSTILFNTKSKVVHDRIDIRRAEQMQLHQFRPAGCTALLDAMGDAMTHIANLHMQLKPEYVPEHTVFVIMTDGEENSSHRYDLKQIRHMVKEREQEFGWEYLFLGANIDGISAAQDLGIRADRAVTFLADSEGIKTSMDAISCANSSIRGFAAPMTANWKQEVEADTMRRGRGKRH